MRRALAVLAASTALIGATLAGTPSASAVDSSVGDAAGDGDQRVLDVTGLRLRNDDDAVRAAVRFVRSGGGHVIVYLQQRGEGRFVSGIYVVHRPQGDDRVRLLTSDGVETCRGLRARFDDDAGRVAFRLPSRCLENGDYGALRASVLTERLDGSDVDSTRRTAWTPRG